MTTPWLKANCQVNTVTEHFIVGIVYIIVVKISLPPTDLAYNGTLLQIFSDPFVQAIAGAGILASGVVFAPLVFYCLRRKNLKTALMVIFSSIFLWLIIVTPFSNGLGIIGAYVVAIASLLYCKLSKMKALEFRMPSN